MNKVGLSIAGLLCTASVVSAQQPGNDRITQLEQRIQTLETELRQYRTSTLSAADQQAIVEKVIADAQARSSAGLNGGKVGYSNGFFLSDQSGNFQLKLNGLLQTRYIYNHNDSSANDNDESGFQIRRAELYLNGNIFSPKFFFQYAGGFDRGGSGFNTVSAYLGYQFDKSKEIRAGAFKPPFMVEELTAAGKQQAVERSFVNTYFTAGTSEGVQFQLSKDNYRAAIMVHDGSNAINSDFAADRTEYAVAARGELKLAGDWSQFGDFQGWSDGKTAARLGAAIDYEAGETGDAAENPDLLKYTVDFTVESDGWNVFLAGVAQHSFAEDSDDADLDQYGLLAQAGVFVIPNRMELFGRYEHIYFDGMFNSTTEAIDDHVNMVTGGVNWFFVGHNAKITTDVIYVFDAMPAGSTGLGLLGSDDGAQVVFRTGMYLMF